LDAERICVVIFIGGSQQCRAIFYLTITTKSTTRQEQEGCGKGCHAKPIKIGKEVKSQVAPPVWQFDRNQPSHQGTNANEA
jgi:hypothetical protein